MVDEVKKEAEKKEGEEDDGKPKEPTVWEKTEKVLIVVIKVRWFKFRLFIMLV